MKFLKLSKKAVMAGHAGLFIFACLFPGTAAAAPTMPEADYVAPHTVRQWRKEQKPLTIVDVREPQEYEAGHIEGAVNIPYNQVQARMDEFDKNGAPYIFYCIHSSWRAPYTANLLVDAGYRNAFVLEGGIAAWNAGGQVIYTSEADPGVVAPYPRNLDVSLTHPSGRPADRELALTLEELARYDGQDGRPAYVAVRGVVYDLTNSRLWRGGAHAPGHGEVMAGKDLTEMIQHSPHGTRHLKDFPVVGRLVKE